MTQKPRATRVGIVGQVEPVAAPYGRRDARRLQRVHAASASRVRVQAASASRVVSPSGRPDWPIASRRRSQAWSATSTANHVSGLARIDSR